MPECLVDTGSWLKNKFNTSYPKTLVQYLYFLYAFHHYSIAFNQAEIFSVHVCSSLQIKGWLKRWVVLQKCVFWGGSQLSDATPTLDVPTFEQTLDLKSAANVDGDNLSLVSTWCAQAAWSPFQPSESHSAKWIDLDKSLHITTNLITCKCLYSRYTKLKFCLHVLNTY